MQHRSSLHRNQSERHGAVAALNNAAAGTANWTNGKRDSHRHSKRLSHNNAYRSSQGMMINATQPVTYQNVDTSALHHPPGRDAESVRKGGFWYNVCSIVTCSACT